MGYLIQIAENGAGKKTEPAPNKNLTVRMDNPG